MRTYFFFVIVFLVSCGDQKTQDSNAKTDSLVTGKKSITEEGKAELDSIIITWPEVDQLDLNHKDYATLWNVVSGENPDTAFLFDWLGKNKMKYAGKDKYFVMQQVLSYSYWKLSAENMDFKSSDPVMQRAIHHLRVLEKKLFDGQLVYHCVEQDPAPVSSAYFFMKDGTVRMYTCFTFCDVEVAKWKKQNGKMVFYNGDKKYTYTETDSSFVPMEGQKTRTLIKFRYNELQ